MKKNMLGLVLAAAMLTLAAPCTALASTPPTVELGKLTTITDDGYWLFNSATASNGKADDGSEIKPTTLTVSVSGAGTISGSQGTRDATNTSVIFRVQDASDVQEHLRYDLAFDGCDKTTKIEVTVSADSASLPSEAASVTKVVDGHCYMYVNKKLSWSAAYNAAKTYTYNGMRGYLATFSTDAEYDTLYSRLSTSGGWIGGTLMLKSGYSKINDDAALEQSKGAFVFKADAAYNDTKATAIGDYYWACGPEAGESVAVDTRSDDEPNAYKHSGTDSDKPWEGMDDTLGMTLYESCLLANFGGNQKIGDITETGFAENGYADGFFVEFGGYGEGKDPGNPDSNKTSTVTWAHAHELQYSAGTNKLTVKCTNDNGYCSIPKDGLTLTIPGNMTIYKDMVVYEGTVEVVGTESERAAWTAAGVDLPTDVSIEYSKTKDGTYAPIEQVRNVGYYKIDVTVQDVTAHAEWEVFQRDCGVIEPKVKDKVYDGTTVGEIDSSATLPEYIIEGDDLHVTGTCTFESAGADDDAAKNVTVTNLKLTGADAGNYDFYSLYSEYTVKAHITRRTVKLNWRDLSFTYDGQEHVPSCAVGDVVEGDKVGVTVSGARTDAGIGVATAALTGDDAASYKLPEKCDKAFEIEARVASLEWGDASFDYDGQEHAPSCTVTNALEGDEVGVSVAGAQRDAGTATATADSLTGASKDNYKLPDEGLTKDFTIAPLTAQLSWDSTQLIYNGSAQAPTCTVSNALEGDDVTVTVSGTRTDAGKGTATASALAGNAQGNYVLPITGLTKDFTIAPLAAQLTWDSTELVYNGSEQAPVCTVSNKVEGDKVTVKVSGAKRDAGKDYEAKANSLEGADAANYELPVAGTSTTFTISPLTAELSWGNTQLTYSGATQAPTCSVANAASGDDVKVTVEGAQTDAGDDYTATAQALTGSAKGNYALPEQKTTAFSIAQREVTLAWGSGYLVYNGTTQVPICELGNLVSGDVVDVVVTGGGSYAGELARAEAKSLTGADAANYKLPTTGLTKEVVITQRELTLTWGETSFTYDGEEHVPNCILGNLVGDDKVNVTVTGARTDAGEGTATAARIDNSNYKLPSQKTVAFTIAKAAIAPAVSIEGWTYGDEAKAPSVTGNPGDGAVTYEYAVRSDEDAQSEDAWSTEAPTAAGEYTVRATVAATDNYEGAVATAGFTIAQREVALEWGETAFTYNGSEQAPSCTAGNLVEGDAVDVTVAGAKADAGEGYTATAASLNNPNYKLPAEGTTREFSIAPLTAELSWGDTALVYSGKEQAPTCTVTNAVAGDKVAVSVSGAQLNVGEAYEAVASALDNANYILPAAGTTVTFSIAPRSIEGAKVTLGPSLTENGHEQEQAVASVTLSDGTVLAATDYELSGNKATKAGAYKLTVTGTGNYTGTVEVEFTVAARPDVKPDGGDDSGKADPDKKDDPGSKDADKRGSKKKIPATGDDSAATIALVAASGVPLAAFGAAARRRKTV